MAIKFTGNWDGAAAILGSLAVTFPNALESALQDEAHFLRKHIVKGITSQAPGGKHFKPLSPITLAIRRAGGFRGSKALIRTGDLRGSIAVVSAGRGAVFVGVPYAAIGADGRKLADVAAVNEFGATMRVALSRARLRFLKGVLRQARSSKEGSMEQGGMGFIRIPPRPFLQPIVDMYMGARGAARFRARVAQKLGGILGVVNHPDLGGKTAAVVPGRLINTRASALMNKGIERAIRTSGGSSRLKTTIRNARKPKTGGLQRPAKIPLSVRIQRRRAAKKQLATSRRSAKKQRILNRLEVKKQRAEAKVFAKLSKAMAPKRQKPSQQNSHVKAMKSHFAKQSKAMAPKQQPMNQHNAHVNAMKSHFAKLSKAMAPRMPPQQNSHVAAMRSHFAKQSKAMEPKRQKPSQQNVHVKAMKSHFAKQSKAMAPKRQKPVTSPQQNAHVKAMRSHFAKQSKAMAPKQQKPSKKSTP